MRWTTIFSATLIGALTLGAAPLAGCSIFGGDGEVTLANMPANLAVNPFAWQATLDTLAFMPMAKLDPAAGRIQTGWAKSGSGTPGEEVRVDVLIVGRELRSDYIAVDVYRRVNGAQAGVSPRTAIEIHAAIVQRARQLVSSADN